MRQIKVVSDGTGFGTHVFDCNGEEITGITALTINADDPRGLVTATLNFSNVALEITAEGEPAKTVKMRKWFTTKEVGSSFIGHYLSKGWKIKR